MPISPKWKNSQSSPRRYQIRDFHDWQKSFVRHLQRVAAMDSFGQPFPRHLLGIPPEAPQGAGRAPEGARQAPPGAGPAPQGADVDGTLLVIPPDERDPAKAAGAKYCNVAERWFAPAGTDLSKLSSWFHARPGALNYNLPLRTTKPQKEQVKKAGAV